MRITISKSLSSAFLVIEFSGEMLWKFKSRGLEGSLPGARIESLGNPSSLWINFNSVPGGWTKGLNQSVCGWGILSLSLPPKGFCCVAVVRKSGKMAGNWYTWNTVSITLLTFLTYPFSHVLFLDFLRKSSLHLRTKGQFLPGGSHHT